MSFLQIPIGTYPNTFLGYQSSISMVPAQGRPNTAFGESTLQNNTTGEQNTAVGYQALIDNVIGISNTAVGHIALRYNKSGYNTALGAGSLAGNVNGFANTAVGLLSLGSVNNASYNTAVGYRSGDQITTGEKNTILGNFNGNMGGVDIRTLNNQIVLSDGDGNPRLWIDEFGRVKFPGTPGGLAFNGSLTITGGTVTQNNPVISATQTWNNAVFTFTGWQLNVTDTASNAASLLMDLQVGGSSRFKIQKDGFISAQANASPSNPTLKLASGGVYSRGGSALFCVSNLTSELILFDGNTLGIGGGIRFFTTGQNLAVNDANPAFIVWDAANTLAQRNGVNAQTLRVYNTFTDASNYERGRFAWVSNVLTIGTENAGTGTARALEIQTAGTTRARFDTAGNAVINTAAIATNATDGFLYVAGCAGTPTGTPTTYTGRVPIVIDTTNNKLYFYSGGAWRDAGP